MNKLNEKEEIEYLPYCIGNIRHNGVVSTSNRLIRPIELSSNEYKALLYAMAVANYGEKNNQDREITEQTYIYLHKDDLGELLGLDKKNSINVAIDRIYKELSSRVAHFVIEEPVDETKRKVKKVHSVVPIIRELRWEDDAKNALQIRFTSEVLPYFTRLASGNFTTYQLKDLFALDSVTSMSLYSYFIKNEFKYANQESYEVELSLENIKALIDIGEKKYDRWVDFRRYVLDKIVEEINEKTSLKLEYDTIKKGRPVVGIRFRIVSRHTETVIPQANEKTQIYLDVDFDDNAIVKELGAKFDMIVRSWYIYANDPNYKQFSKWFKTEGCLTNSQANVIVNDIMFQMDFAVAGASMNDFKREMKYKLKNDPNFVQQNCARLNEIFGKEII
ncbi:RepB family plasmid replication initiator protein [Acinetobacter gerneri]|uniref:RepB family plasmid replication initiator protein n=1 Tax=Acinetobacter gerneri TaxID=202952 RepID=A0AAW8JMM4_9GAMM|nr:RepB family plasmid replication initiator protein [Acinetobacter gerneri]MDQ9012087.1 RepB family plasmid replication initiator protein [Acinetobacter gerneri]MDQ9016191.1 RepB family plasmid replication initiator protein [Acinetobacter gerneri]MDQ9027400.1 RepB family plasmid replication initiator protein [Acinetobacter gerneri]MDQ9054656.1 RepB family plasmid replication initiator protein [Acinetobacter gerneri]MDQ9062310.1 RepB family plasmid replication initiator protein [Acinetobacter 